MRSGVLHCVILLLAITQCVAIAQNVKSKLHSSHQQQQQHVRDLEREVQVVEDSESDDLEEEDEEEETKAGFRDCSNDVSIPSECNPFIYPELLAHTALVKNAKGRSIMPIAEGDEKWIEDWMSRFEFTEEQLAKMFKQARKVDKRRKNYVRVKMTNQIRERAIKRCLQKYIQPASVALAHWVPDYANMLYTYGDEGKFSSWGFKKETPSKRVKGSKFKFSSRRVNKHGVGKTVLVSTRRTVDPVLLKAQMYERQTAFVQGRETMHFYTLYMQPLIEELFTSKGASGVNDFLLQTLTLSSKVFDTMELINAYKEIDMTQYTTPGAQQYVKTMYMAAAAVRVYPVLPYVIKHIGVDRQPASTFSIRLDQDRLETFPLPIPSGANDEVAAQIWERFRAGLAFGVTRGGFDSTGGNGVYMALTVTSTDNGHGDLCLKCPVPPNTPTLNVDPVTHPCAVRDLMIAGFLKLSYAEEINQKSQMEMNMIAVNKKNLFVYPIQAERLIRDHLFVFRPEKLNAGPDFPVPYIADKGALDWNSCTFCDE